MAVHFDINDPHEKKPFCILVTGIVLSPLILGCISMFSQIPWTSANVQLPVLYCENGDDQYLDGTDVPCINNKPTLLLHEFTIGSSPRYASIVTDGLSNLQLLEWPELTSANICQRSTSIFQQYSSPTGFCRIDGSSIAPDSSYAAGIVTIFAFSVFFLLVIFPGFLGCFKKYRRKHFNFAISLNLLALFTASYALGNWDSYARVMSRYNIAPLRNMTITYQGVGLTRYRQLYVKYKVTPQSGIIVSTSPPIYNSTMSTGYILWVVVVCVLAAYTLLILSVWVLQHRENKKFDQVDNDNTPLTPSTNVEEENKEMEEETTLACV
jgi:hypothetical protein